MQTLHTLKVLFIIGKQPLIILLKPRKIILNLFWGCWTLGKSLDIGTLNFSVEVITFWAGLCESLLMLTHDLKNRIINSLSLKCCSLLVFCAVFFDSQLKDRQYNQKTLPKSCKSEISILADADLA